MAVHLGIIGINHVATMIKMAEASADGSYKTEDDNYIIYSLDNLLVHNLYLFYCLKKS